MNNLKNITNEFNSTQNIFEILSDNEFNESKIDLFKIGLKKINNINNYINLQNFVLFNKSNEKIKEASLLINRFCKIGKIFLLLDTQGKKNDEDNINEDPLKAFNTKTPLKPHLLIEKVLCALNVIKEQSDIKNSYSKEELEFLTNSQKTLELALQKLVKVEEKNEVPKYYLFKKMLFKVEKMSEVSKLEEISQIVWKVIKYRSKNDLDIYDYEGEMQDGLPDGKGKAIFSNGTSFSGNFKQGMFHGNGILKSKDETICDGEFRYDQLNGQVKVTFQNGMTFEGLYKNDKPNGFGKLKNKQGYSYIGMFNDGLKHGYGKMEFAGHFYQGQFYNDLPSGTGEMKFSNGEVYIGDLQYGLAHGDGMLTFPDGSSYDGEFQNGLVHGKGKLKFADGATYEGTFKYDTASEGTYTTANGIIYKYPFKITGENKIKSLHSDILINGFSALNTI